MAKQLTCQRYILKLRSSRLRKARWNLTLPLAEARRNDELISLADSQIIRWLDELNGITDADAQAKAIKYEIRRLKREPNDIQTRRRIRKLYEELDAIQFKPDYVCLIMDREKDYHQACKGFKINGMTFHRLLGTNGGVKSSTIVFIADRHGDEIRRRIDNGREPDTPLVPAKLEAYKALTCSASTPVSQPNGIIVVPDCETEFFSDVVYIDDTDTGEPSMETKAGEPVTLNESDGYGIMLPSLAERWATDIGIDYLPSGVNTRYSFEKGMVFTFDYLEFAETVAGSYMVTDAWGQERDVRDAELILTTSMVKLWDSYDSCEEYIRNCTENHYTFGVAKVAPKALEDEHTMNYQFLNPFDLTDEDIDELIEPTMSEIQDVLNDDWRKTVLFAKGVGLNEHSIERMEDDFIKAMLVEPGMIDDPYVQSKIFQLIKRRITDAEVGVIKTHGNYSIVCGDPYSLCQSMFGLPVTGLLKPGEIYNRYWVDAKSLDLLCFRAPMTCMENIRAVHVNTSAEAQHWYQYMTTCTLFNSFDDAASALNGMDKDGDLVMLTDNPVLLRRHKRLPTITCVQHKAEKKVVTDADAVAANINSFGDDIGKITNRITAMYDVRSRFTPGSPEYEELEYRIRCGQKLQQDAVDKSKGIISNPMPRAWYDRHYALAIEDDARRALYLSILADKKPYFMRYIYPDLMRQYNTYIKSTDKKSMREFGLSVAELLATPADKLTEQQADFLSYYTRMMPVGTEDCVTNRICRRFESAFKGYVGKHNATTEFDYTIMKSGVDYRKEAYFDILHLYEEYNRRLRAVMVYAGRERVDDDETSMLLSAMNSEFRASCRKVCPNSRELCDIMLDICYKRSSTKQFVWSVCGEDIIDNLLDCSGGTVWCPVPDEHGDISFGGRRFFFVQKELEGWNEYHYE